MNELTWIVAVLALLAGGLIGYLAARFSGPGKRMHELEAEIEKQKEQMAEYQKNVDAHFDKTANLFVSMTGSYKALYEHLSEGYEKLAPGSRILFRERMNTMLLTETPRETDYDASDAVPPAPDFHVTEKPTAAQETEIQPPETHVLEDYEKALATSSEERENDGAASSVNPEVKPETEEDIPVLNDKVEQNAPYPRNEPKL